MSGGYGLAEAAELLGIEVKPQEMARLEAVLRAEVASIEPYADAVLCIKAIKAAGIKVGICSNLAMPYGAAVTRHFPDLDAYGFSFDVGVLKPDRRIYETVLRDMGVAAEDTWMVGDSQRAISTAPRRLALKGTFCSGPAVSCLTCWSFATSSSELPICDYLFSIRSCSATRMARP